MIQLLMILFIIVIPSILIGFFVLRNVYKICIKNCILLNFSQFKSFYSINPSKWNLEWTSYTMRYQKGNGYDYYKIAIKSYIEYLFLFKPFKKNINKKIQQEQNDKELTIVLQDIQNDINGLKKQAQEELQQATNTYVLISENIYYNKINKGIYIKDISTDTFYPAAGTIKMGENKK